MNVEYKNLRLPEGYSRERFIELAQEDPRYEGVSKEDLGAFHDLRSPSFADRLFDIRNQHLNTTKENFTFKDMQTTIDSVMTSIIQLVSPAGFDTKYQLNDHHISQYIQDNKVVKDHVSVPAVVSVLDYWELVNT